MGGFGLLAACLVYLPLQQLGETSEHVEYYESGSVRTRGTLVLGAEGKKTLHGPFRSFFEDGQLAVEGTYDQGVAAGEWTHYHPGGGKAAQGSCDKGRRVGQWTCWAEDGSFDARNSGFYGWVENEVAGRALGTGATLDSHRTGPWSWSWGEGGPRVECHYYRSALHGSLRLYHADGTFEHELASCEFRMGKRKGRTIPPPIRPVMQMGDLDSDPRADANFRAWLRDPGQEAERALLEGGQASFAPLLNHLACLDLESGSDRSAAQPLCALLLRLCAGQGYEWDPGEPHLAGLRWRTFWWLARDHHVFWSLSLPMARKRPELAGAIEDIFDLSGLLARTIPNTVGGVPLRPFKFGVVLAEGGQGVWEPLDEGLAWLAKEQDSAGCWRDEVAGEATRNEIGTTAQVGLALLQRGNTLEDGLYSPHLRKAVLWLCSQQNPATGQIGTSDLPAAIAQHAMATACLAEASRKSDSRPVRIASQLGLDYLVSIRKPEGHWGPATFDAVEAFCNGIGARLQVDRDDFHSALTWLDQATDPETGRVTLARPRGPNQGILGGGDCTGQGAYARYNMMQRRAHSPLLRLSLDYLTTIALPGEFNADFDPYELLWGSRAVVREGKKTWRLWYVPMKELVLNSQDPDGSWPSRGPYGRVLMTALMAQSLETFLKPQAL